MASSLCVFAYDISSRSAFIDHWPFRLFVLAMMLPSAGHSTPSIGRRQSLVESPDGQAEQYQRRASQWQQTHFFLFSWPSIRLKHLTAIEPARPQ